jgi:prepilin-type N-terminal cleavage/methylation domain-containing protein
MKSKQTGFTAFELIVTLSVISVCVLLIGAVVGVIIKVM